MKDEAIFLIQKQIYMYQVMRKNIRHYSIEKDEKNKLRAKVRAEIKIREYILKELLKKWGVIFGGNKKRIKCLLVW